MIPKVITQPAEELITLEECRQHLEVTPYTTDSDGDTHPDDAIILAMLSSAREACEAFTGLCLARKTLEIALDEFPGDDPIELPAPPLVSVTSITVGTESDAEMDPADYVVDDYTVPARVLPAVRWPNATASTNLIKIRYEAGYGTESDEQPLPWAARAAILLLLGDLYRNREDSAEKTLVSVPNGVQALLRPLRVNMGFA